MTKNIFLLLLISIGISVQAQHTYHLRWAKDAPIGVSVIGIGTAAFFLHKHKPTLTEADISALQISDINRMDRSATKYWNPTIAKVSDVGWISSMTLPALIFIDKSAREEYKPILGMWSQVFAGTMAVTALTKNIANRTRPYAYNPNVPMSQKIKKDATASFFSGHTSMTAASCFFTAKVYADLHPDSRWKPLMWTGASTIPALVGFLRYRSGKHFFTDILTGYAVGAIMGIIVPQIHKKRYIDNQ